MIRDRKYSRDTSVNQSPDYSVAVNRPDFHLILANCAATQCTIADSLPVKFLPKVHLIVRANGPVVYMHRFLSHNLSGPFGFELFLSIFAKILS